VEAMDSTSSSTNARTLGTLIITVVCQCLYLSGLWAISEAILRLLPRGYAAVQLPVIAQAPFLHALPIFGGGCFSLVILLVLCARSGGGKAVRMFALLSMSLLLVITSVYLYAIAVALTPTGSVWRSSTPCTHDAARRGGSGLAGAWSIPCVTNQ
jgi:hypothetical protein